MTCTLSVSTTPQNAEIMFCKFCGAWMQEKYKFCPRCGRNACENNTTTCPTTFVEQFFLRKFSKGDFSLIISTLSADSPLCHIKPMLIFTPSPVLHFLFLALNDSDRRSSLLRL